jgi:hypothetical protein
MEHLSEEDMKRLLNADENSNLIAVFLDIINKLYYKI